MFATERLYLTAKRDRIVPEGDKEAATLYAAPGDEIPDSAAELFGLVDGTIGNGAKGSGNKGGTKEQKPGSDKEQKPGGDKGASGGTKGTGTAPADATSTPAADDLTKVTFVGPKVAAGLVGAGITTFVQIAAIDAVNPPAVEGTGARTNWAGIVASAQEIVAAASAGTEPGGGDASGDAGAEAGATDQQAN